MAAALNAQGDMVVTLTRNEVRDIFGPDANPVGNCRPLDDAEVTEAINWMIAEYNRIRQFDLNDLVSHVYTRRILDGD